MSGTYVCNRNLLTHQRRIEMPYYKPIRNIHPTKTRLRTLSSLKRLRQQLENEMPPKTRNSTLILGTWNIRNFDDDRFKNGPRTDEDFQYIAEIISRFDVLAVQEICNSTKPLDQIIYLLGGNYDYIVTDITEGKSGNGERLGFIFDRNKVKFKGIAGELVLPNSMQIIHDDKKLQFSRTPFMCSFQAGWFKFVFSTVHIYFGSPSGEKYEHRIKEINQVAKFLAKRSRDDDQNHILVGDFNIVKPGSPGYNALAKHGFEIYQNREGSNKDNTKFYDQISFRIRKDELYFSDSDRSKGVLQFFDSIYRTEDFESYKDDLRVTIQKKIKRLEEEIQTLTEKQTNSRSENKKSKLEKSIKNKEKTIQSWEKCSLNENGELEEYYLKEWRTFHGSDHLPLWIELDIDFSDAYLERLSKLSKIPTNSSGK